ncbi:SAM-dependent methyltransferase [Nonomuraea sp. NPDC046802]|uniref:SAM-dependent methyltransferase n=1 Tax=Nonomuraea sp. NPDC046802 TaxID=3154919 RepID=UPI00340F6DE2
MNPTSLDGIGETAVGVAALRALENARQDRLFVDPYAERFVEAVAGDGYWEKAPSGWAGFAELLAGQVAVRTRYLDEALLRAAAEGCGQVVLLASGMDARAYRLDWPAGTRVYEIDFAEVLAFKAGVLKGVEPRCEHVEVPADLRTDWPGALREAGFSPERPTAWLAEGMLYALPPEAADVLLDRVSRLSAPGSVLAADHAPDNPVLRESRAALSPDLVDLWLGGPRQGLGDWLRGRGWAAEVRDVNEVAAEYSRPAPPAFDPARDGSGPGWLFTARLAG